MQTHTGKDRGTDLGTDRVVYITGTDKDSDTGTGGGTDKGRDKGTDAGTVREMDAGT